MHRVFRVSSMAVLMAVFQVIRRSLQLLALIGRQERQDLLVVGLVQFFRLGAACRLRLGELRDLRFLVAAQLHRLDELKRFLEVVDETGGLRAAG